MAMDAAWKAMSLEERLARIIDGIPSGGSVTLPVDFLRGLLCEKVVDIDQGQADLTVEQIAEEYRRSVSTVRGWLAEELIPGAYKLRGREWRVPQSGLRKFLAQQSAQHGSPGSITLRQGEADLGSWRKIEVSDSHMGGHEAV